MESSRCSVVTAKSDSYLKTMHLGNINCPAQVPSTIICIQFPNLQRQRMTSNMDTTNTIDRPRSMRSSTKDEIFEVDRIETVEELYLNAPDTLTDFEKQKTVEGEAHFRRLGWKRLTVILIVEAIGLGVFSLPGAFSTLGIIGGAFCSVSVGLLAVYTGYIIGKVKVVYPDIHHYGDIGRLLMGRFGEELLGIMYVLQLILMTSSYVLTGTIAFSILSDAGVCSLVFSAVSAILLFTLAIMPSFTEAAILGYIDLLSVLSAIGVAVVASGVNAANSAGGLTSVNWSAWPDPDADFNDCMVAICNMIFAYSFAMYMIPFMTEMHTPSDYMKSIWTLGVIEILVYTLTGALIYIFIGMDVKSPALLSLSGVLPKVTFGVAIPIIFISGAIGNTVTARYVHLRLFKNSIIRFINTPKGWISWLTTLAAITVCAWILGEAIPFFSDLLSLSSSLFVSGFVFYFPPVMWYILLRKGKWHAKENLLHASICMFAFVFGLLVLIGGTYSSVKSVVSLLLRPGFRKYARLTVSTERPICKWCYRHTLLMRNITFCPS